MPPSPVDPAPPEESRAQQDALRRSEAFLDRTGRAAGIGGWEVDLVTQCVTWSAETRRIHGVGPDYEPDLQSAISFYAPEARSVVEQAVRRAMADGTPWDLELPFDRADGRRIWVRAVGQAEFDGDRPVRLSGAFQDITARKQLEQRLREGQTFLREVMDISPQGMYVSDPQDGCTYSNASLQRIVGLGLEQTLGAGLRSVVHPEDLPIVEAQRQAALDRPGIHTAEHRFVRRGGEVVWVRRHLTRLRRGGEDDVLVGNVEDITERRRLDQALAERSAALARSNEDLERFAYLASHDLQEPLRMVVSYGHLLQRRHREAFTGEAAEFLDFMIDGGHRGLAMIRDLLSLARVENHPHHRHDIDLSAVMAEVLKDLEPAIRTNAAAVRFDPLPQVHGDRNQLRQVLVNLVGNALKFRGEAPPGCTWPRGGWKGPGASRCATTASASSPATSTASS